MQIDWKKVMEVLATVVLVVIAVVLVVDYFTQRAEQPKKVAAPKESKSLLTFTASANDLILPEANRPL